MKKLLLIICGILLVAGSYAQSKESKMNYVYSLDEALQKAKKENKLIFFNCFADWVITCHGMDKAVFSDEAFAKYMDKNFVNLFIDVSVGENKFIAEKYSISFFAHYLVLDSNGEIVHRIVGGAQLPKFQDNVALALNPKTSLRGMNKRYDDGENSTKFLREYLKVLTLASEEAKYETVLARFLEKLSPKDWAKSENWDVIRKLLKKEDGEYFKYMIENKKEFAKNNGIENINKIIANVYMSELFSYVVGNVEINSNKLGLMRVKLNKADLPEDDMTYRLLTIAKYRGEKKYDEMVNALETNFKDGDERMMDMINISFKEIKDAVPAQKKVLLSYLKEVAKSREGSTLKQYMYAISQIEEFKGIDFFKGTFAEALAQAKKENKLIFLDAYTSWCGPCQAMSTQVFVRKDVGEYFNKNFINLKIDMEQGEGVELAKKFDITAYPTMFLIDGEGNMVHKILGGSDAKGFIEKIQRGTVKETSYAYLVDNFEVIKDDPRLYINYLVAKNAALEMPDVTKPMTEYLLKVKNIEDLATPEIVEAVASIISDYRNQVVLRIVDNSALISGKIGAEKFEKSMEKIFFPVVLKCIKGEESNAVYEEVRLLIKKMNLSKSTSLTHLVNIADLNNKKDGDKIIAYYENVISKVSDAHTKLNLDMLLTYITKSFSSAQQNKTREYIKVAASKADPRAEKGYQSLIENI